MRHFVIALLIMAVLMLTISGAEDESTTTLYLRAMQHEQDGELDQAYSIYQRILLKENSPTVYLKLADLEIKRGNHESAYNILLKAQERNPGSSEIFFRTGVYASEMATREEPESPARTDWLRKAQASFSAAARLEPSEQHYVAVALVATEMNDHELALQTYNTLINDLEQTEYYRGRGILYLDTGRRTEGIEDLEKAAALHEDIQAYIRLADISLKDNDTDTALTYLLKASELRPDLVLPDLYLGEIYRDRKDYDSAIHFYMQASQSMQGVMKVAVLKQVGGLALEKEDFQAALNAYLTALDETNEDQQIYYLAGYAASRLEDYTAAQQLFDEALDLYPDYAMLRKRSALNLIYLNRPAEAVEVIRWIDPIERDIEYYLLLTNAYEDLEETENAINTLKEGLDDYPLSMELYLSLAIHYERSKMYEECIELLKQALVIEPDSPVLQNFLGYLYADLNIHLDEAEKLINSALAQEPENYAYIDSKAWLEYRQGNYEAAYELMLRAVEINPDDPEIIEHMNAIQEKVDALQK